MAAAPIVQQDIACPARAPPIPVGGGSQRRQRRGRDREVGASKGNGVPWSSNHARGQQQVQQQTEMFAHRTSSEKQNGNSKGNQSGFGDGREPEPMPQAQLEKMIREFKTMACAHGSASCSHDHRCCPFFHSDRDRRRSVLGSGESPLYCAEPCNEQFDSQRCCSRSDDCKFCHSTAELLYHPDVFRKRLCYQAKRCPRGRYCAFAHSRQELLVPHFGETEEGDPSEEFIAFRFKTQWCPIGGPHDWESCVYAHTYRDWRRTPLIGYSSRPCPQWTRSITNGSPELSYDDRCPKGMACPLAHGSKEQLYHPHFYKTSPCSESLCKRGSLCAFTHGPHDTRHPSSEESVDVQITEEARKNVMMILHQYQPTYWNPPKYHQLEDPGRGSTGFINYPKSRGQRRRSQQQIQQAIPDARAASSPRAATTSHNLDSSVVWEQQQDGNVNQPPQTYTVAAAQGPDMQASPSTQYWPDIFQWVPCTEGQPQMPQIINYGEYGVESWGMQYTPMVWDQSQNALTQVIPASPVTKMRQDGSTSHNASHNEYYRSGMRTPSSLGSPRLSATPTEAPSPRPEGANGSGGSGEASSDDVIIKSL